ncbi:hypothetical protein Mapa_010695 [Marchantia paleacea]|nr:hypothetical protein Mapa_010695 [Marchantia paleacea]
MLTPGYIPLSVPAIEVMNMMEPPVPASRIFHATALPIFQLAFTLTSIVPSYSFSVVSIKGFIVAETELQLTKTLTLPNIPHAASTACLYASSPAAWSSSTVLTESDNSLLAETADRGRDFPINTTRHPRLANSRANLSPSSSLPPWIRATLLSTSEEGHFPCAAAMR